MLRRRKGEVEKKKKKSTYIFSVYIIDVKQRRESKMVMESGVELLQVNSSEWRHKQPYFFFVLRVLLRTSRQHLQHSQHTLIEFLLRSVPRPHRVSRNLLNKLQTCLPFPEGVFFFSEQHNRNRLIHDILQRNFQSYSFPHALASSPAFESAFIFLLFQLIFFFLFLYLFWENFLFTSLHDAHSLQ